MVKQMSMLDKIRQTSQASPTQEQPQTKGKKRKVPESTPAMAALAEPLKSSRATHKLSVKSSRANLARQSSGSAGVTKPQHIRPVLGIPVATAARGDNVFRPNWAVQKTDTGLGDSRVAAEVVYQGVLPRDRRDVENEAPETCEAAITSALYQLQVYSKDMAKKRYLFSETLTQIESEKSQLQKEKDRLTEAVQIKEATFNSLKDELQRVKNQAVQDLLNAKERADQREKAAITAAVKAAVREAVKETEKRKDTQFFNLGLQAYKAGFLFCSDQVKKTYPDISLDGLAVPYAPPEEGEDEEEDEPDSSQPIEVEQEVVLASEVTAPTTEAGQVAVPTSEAVTEEVVDEEA
ncbi:uncharacterized protein LOC143885318 isoform X2 [Tasmannia lanceolata]